MWTQIDSPIGPLRLVGDGEAINAIDFLGDMPTGDGEAASVRRAALRIDGRPLDGPAEGRADGDPLLREAVDQLAAYFRRELKDFDLPLRPTGSAFQLRVWEQLRAIGYGETASYGQVAGRLGMTNAASRAVGLANGRNPIPIVIPCHRVNGANGTLTGYAGGLERKQLLLELEQDALF
jgi:methylated-DNA-[protein]-cysteine S-methyltransferase